MTPDASTWEVWGPPVVVLLVALVVGLIFALRAQAKGADARAAEDRAGDRDALAARKASLVEQLRLLEADRDKLDPQTFADRHAALLAAAADALRQLDAPAPAPPALSPSPADRAADRRALQAGLWVAAAVAFFGVLGVLLSRSTADRAPGATMTGNSQAAAEPAEVAAAREALAANAQDLAAINTLSYHFLTTRQLDAAMTHIDQARAIRADDPDVLLHLAILQMSVGMFDRAAPLMDQARAAQPERGRFWLWTGLLHLYQNDREKAVESVEKSLQLGIRADEQAFARQLLAEARSPAPAAAGAPAAGAAAAGAAAAGASGAPAVGGVTYSGPGGGEARLEVSVGLGAGLSPDPEQVVFVMVYANDGGRPPPVATARLRAGDLPASLRFEDGHTMGGSPWPAQVWVKARLDADGRPGSSAGDVDSALAPGGAPVSLTLGP